MQEAEQRRITEAQQRQNLERVENYNPSQGQKIPGYNPSAKLEGSPRTGMSPTKSGMSPAMSGISPAMSGMSPTKSAMSPALSGMSYGPVMNGGVPVTENIYANVDSSHIPYTRNQRYDRMQYYPEFNASYN